MIGTEEKEDGRGKALSKRKAREQAARLTNLKEILKGFKGVEFPHITKLSDEIAKKFLAEYKDVINPGTLRRNKAYRKHLDKFLKNEEIKDNELMELTENLLIEQSENYQLSTELKNANKTITELLTDLSASGNAALESRSHGHVAAFNEIPCNALMKILVHVGDFDIKRSGIYDEASINNDLVLSAEDYPEFFDWYFKEK